MWRSRRRPSTPSSSSGADRGGASRRAGARILDGAGRDRALDGAGRGRALDGAGQDRALDGADPNGARWSCVSATRSFAARSNTGSGTTGTTAVGTVVRLRDTNRVARTAAGAEGPRDTNRAARTAAGTQARVRRRRP